MDYSLSKASKALKRLSKRLKKVRGSLLILFLGLLLLSYGGLQYYRIRILSFTKTPAQAQTANRGELPSKITIPSIGIDLPVDIGRIKDGVWQISYDHPTFLDTSARPGTGGNIVIYGHNKRAIFGNLPYLSIGQKIIIKTQDGKTHTYIATQKYFVGPDRVDLVSPENSEELTIYTCWGLFDGERAVIKAIPI